jgi:hypothetical protein
MSKFMFGLPQLNEKMHKSTVTKLNRTEQHDAAEKILSHFNEGKKYVSVKAPVKSGKKDIKSFLVMDNMQKLYSPNEPIHNTILCTSVARKDSEEQLEQLASEGYVICRTSCELSSKSPVPESNRVTTDSLYEQIVSNPNVTFLIVWDESDYGTGISGNSWRLLELFKHVENVKVVFFSATPQEVEGSDLAKREDYTDEVVFTPAPDYVGAARFLADGLVRDVGLYEDFFDKDTLTVTPTGKEFLQELIDSDKDYSVVRLSKRGQFNSMLQLCSRHDPGSPLERAYLDRLLGPNVVPVFINQDAGDETGILEDPNSEHFAHCANGIKFVVFLNMKYTRSAELHTHDRMHGWFEQRNKDGKHKSNFASVLQSVLRCAHYSSKYDGKANIRLWVPEVVLLAEAANDFSYIPKKNLGCRVNPSYLANKAYDGFIEWKYEELPQEEAHKITATARMYKGNRTSIVSNALPLINKILNNQDPNTGDRKGPFWIYADEQVPASWNTKYLAKKESAEYQKLVDLYPGIKDAKSRGVVPVFYFDFRTIAAAFDPSEMESTFATKRGRNGSAHNDCDQEFMLVAE